jgi:hypothetical protein
VEAVCKLVRRQIEFGMALRDLLGSVFVARCARIFTVGCRVAGLAGNFAAVTAVVQGESVFPQGGRAPTLVGVAVIAVRAKEPGMKGRFLVAGNTTRGCAPELIVLVAVCALQIVMLSFEGEYHLVVKPVQAVYPVMANQAVCTVLLDVFIHKSRIVAAVAVLAGLWVKCQLLSHVAVCTQERSLGVIRGMPVKGESGETMVK